MEKGTLQDRLSSIITSLSLITEALDYERPTTTTEGLHSILRIVINQLESVHDSRDIMNDMLHLHSVLAFTVDILINHDELEGVFNSLLLVSNYTYDSIAA